MRRRQINVYFTTLYRRRYDAVNQCLFRRILTNLGMSHRRRCFVEKLPENSDLRELCLLTCFGESQVPRIISRVSIYSILQRLLFSLLTMYLLFVLCHARSADVTQAETNGHSLSSNLRQRILVT